MKILFNKRKIIWIIGSVLFLGSFFNFVEAEEIKKNEQNGMIFVVGEYKPELNNEKQRKNKNPLADVAVKRENVSEPLGKNSEDYENDDENQMGDVPENISQIINTNDNILFEKNDNFSMVIVGAIKELWEKIKNINEKLINIFSQLDEISSDVKDNKEGLKNVNNLIETTGTMTEELVDHENRLNNLENNK